MDEHGDFLSSLRLNKPKEYVFIPLIFVSHPPDEHAQTLDEVIGLWYLNMKHLQEPPTDPEKLILYKQDFIVNVKGDGKEFHSYISGELYKREKGFNKSVYVHTIKDFYEKYGENRKYYTRPNHKKFWMHHYRDENELPDEPSLKSAALMVKIKNSRFRGASK
jgi:hypothetical protein